MNSLLSSTNPKKLVPNTWLTQNYKINSSLIDNALIKYYATKFWSEFVNNKITKDQHLNLIFKFIKSNGDVYSLCKKQTVMSSDLEFIISILQTNNNSMLDHYKLDTEPIVGIQVLYTCNVY